MPEAFSILLIPETAKGNLFLIKLKTSSGKIPVLWASLTFISGSNETSRKLDASNII